MTDPAESSDLLKTINHLLDDILGLDRSNNLVEVVATPGTERASDGPYITIEFTFTPGSWAHDIVKLLPLRIFTDRLTDSGYAFELQAEIKKQLDPQIAAFIAKRTEGLGGIERGIIAAATNALELVLSSQILKPLSGRLAVSLLNLDLPERARITDFLGTALDDLGELYFRLFIPEIAKTYAKLGLSEILTVATSGSSPEWATAIRSVGDGVFGPVIDNIVHNYFLQEPYEPAKLFDNIEFSEVFGNAIAGLLIDFETLDKEILDDLLGLDGENKIEEWVEKLLQGKIQDLVESGFAKALEFLAGDFNAEDVTRLFAQFTGQFDVQSLLGNFFVRYASQQLAELFVDIDSLPEALVSQLGATVGSSLLGQALGDLAIDAVTGLFGQATLNVIGGAIFKGLGAMLGAGVGAVAGSVVFELIDDLFDGAISDLFNDFLDWIRNDSPQAFYNMTYDPISNRFEFGGDNYSKDSNDQMRLAVKMLGEAWAERVNQVIAFVDQPASFDPLFNNVYVVWGKKHYDSDYASFIGWEQRLAQSPDAEHVAKVTIGMVLNHMNFQSGHPVIAAAYELWKAVVGAGGGTALTFVEPDAMVRLQELIGLARFANDYRQDPTYFDLLMGSDAPVAITILQQYLEAEVKGFNGPVTLKGSVVGFETIGSAAAGDTIVLDGPAWRAMGRGGDDIVHVGAAVRQEIDGGTGSDTIVLGKDIGAYFATVNRPDRSVTLIDQAAGITIVVANVETFKFNGATYSFDAAFPNRAPVIVSNGGGNSAQLSVPENSLVVTRVAATDIDGDAPKFEIVGGADAALFRIDPTTGALSFAAPPDFETPLDSNHDNVYAVIVTAHDGLAGDTQAISVHLTDGIEGNFIPGTSSLDWIDLTRAPPGLLTSTDRDDRIYTLDGDDLVNAGGGNDLVLGHGGYDILSGGAGNDQLFGGTGNDFLGGGADDDLLSGEDGDDLLEGGTGADLMLGGAGNDIYIVDSGDQVFEAPGGGVDEVRSSVAYTLGANVENLVAFGAGVGNDLDNVITGSSINDSLSGGGGDDKLDGGAGADWLSGGTGN
ncbi:MAG: hypothetical protein ABWX67_16240, partial [Allosphingosinicella sp.]